MTRRLPTEAQRDEYCEGLLALRVKVGPKGAQIYRVEQLVQRIRKALERDRSESAIPDGFPRGSGFEGRGGGLTVKVRNELGHDENVPVTAVEWTAIARQEHPTDTFHESVRAMMDDLRTAVSAIDRIYGRLDSLDGVKPATTNLSDPGCKSCARYRDARGEPYFSSADIETGGRRGYCKWCLGWVTDHDDEMPPVELIERRARGQRITTAVVEELTAAAKRKTA